MGVRDLFRSAFGNRSAADENWAERFEKECPLSLPGRLEFLQEKLGLSRERVLRLAGAPPAFAADPKVAQQPWDALVAQQGPDVQGQLEAAEKRIADFLAQFGYNWPAAASRLRDERSAWNIHGDEELLRCLNEAEAEEAFLLLTEFLSREVDGVLLSAP